MTKPNIKALQAHDPWARKRRAIRTHAWITHKPIIRTEYKHWRTALEHSAWWCICTLQLFSPALPPPMETKIIRWGGAGNINFMEDQCSLSQKGTIPLIHTVVMSPWQSFSCRSWESTDFMLEYLEPSVGGCLQASHSLLRLYLQQMVCEASLHHDKQMMFFALSCFIFLGKVKPGYMISHIHQVKLMYNFRLCFCEIYSLIWQ